MMEHCTILWVQKDRARIRLVISFDPNHNMLNKFSGWKNCLVVKNVLCPEKNTEIWFPEPILGGSRPPVNPVPAD